MLFQDLMISTLRCFLRAPWNHVFPRSLFTNQQHIVKDACILFTSECVGLECCTSRIWLVAKGIQCELILLWQRRGWSGYHGKKREPKSQPLRQALTRDSIPHCETGRPHLSVVRERSVSVPLLKLYLQTSPRAACIRRDGPSLSKTCMQYSRFVNSRRPLYSYVTFSCMLSCDTFTRPYGSIYLSCDELVPVGLARQTRTRPVIQREKRDARASLYLAYCTRLSTTQNTHGVAEMQSGF